MITLLTHIAKLLTFQHRGRGLNWDLAQTKTLIATALLFPFLLYLTYYGGVVFFDTLIQHWGYVVLAVATVAFSFRYLERVMFLRTEVGVALLCCAFSVIRLTFNTVGIDHAYLDAAINAWQVSALVWYVLVSRVTVTLTRDAKQIQR